MLPSHLVHQHSPLPGGTLSHTCPAAVFPTHPRHATRMGQTSGRDDLREAERFFSLMLVFGRPPIHHPVGTPLYTRLAGLSSPRSMSRRNRLRKSGFDGITAGGAHDRARPTWPADTRSSRRIPRISYKQPTRLGRFLPDSWDGGQRWDDLGAFLVNADSDGGQFWRAPRGAVVAPITFGQLHAVTSLGHLGFSAQSIAPRR